MKPASDVRKPYTGPVRALVVALDVGTTFSGVSYAILEPGEIPKIHGVTRFPGQEHVAGNSKIPSVLYYDRDGTVMCAGAEADNASVTSQAEDECWIKAELFKLRLRPKSMKLNMNGMRLSALPRNKSPVDVFGDFLRYLFRCTRSFIIDTHANGKALWQAVEHAIEFVLSHPNGWEGAQQTRMRRAAVYGGLIPDTDEGRARIRFVTEGEASLHACVQSGLAADVLSNPSSGFLVADAGGGTLDISSYAVRGTTPLVIEEIAPPDCIFAGSVFVSRRAREFLAEKLKSSRYGSSDSIDHITKRFDETTKRLFRDKNDIQWVPFGSPLDKDLAVGIRGGSLKLTGAEVAELFEPSIQAAVSSIKSQVAASQGMIKSVWLVGGFAASPWLFTQLKERLASMKITVSRPDNQTSKAVADGALGFYCDHHVSARMSKFLYGVEYLREFDPNDPEHVSRRERLCELPSGPQLLPDAFDCILARGVKVKESTVFTRKYCTELTNLSTLSVFEVEIWCFRGGDMIPPWILRHHEDYGTLCVVRADLSPLSGSAEPKTGRNGKMYWTIVFSVEIHFGLTEFKARIKWNDNGRTKYGPASIVYSESGHRADEDETDVYSEDDFGPSRAASRAPSRPASVAPSRTHSQDSIGSGAKTPQGQISTRLDATFMDAVSRSRAVSTSQSTHSRSQSYQSQSQSQAQLVSPTPQPQSPPAPQYPYQQQQQQHVHQHAHQQYQQQQQQATSYTERTREFEQRERSVSSSAAASVSRLSASVSHVERDRKVSAASKMSSSYASQSRAESDKERRTREAAVERERAAVERDRVERERVVAEREKLERERAEREREWAERAERERVERERIEQEIERERVERERERERGERERTTRERIGRETVEKERVERERIKRERFEKETIEKERIERETVERVERERVEREIVIAERERVEQEQVERELQAERDRIAAPVKGKKGKGAKNASKLSPIDYADTMVGKSPGQLGQTLTTVWGSQSNAVTPAASPFPSSARSMGPGSSKPAARELEPPTPALSEAPPSIFFSSSSAEEYTSSGLALDVSHTQVLAKHDDPLAGQTPADSVPPEQLVSESAEQSLGVFGSAAEMVETKTEYLEETFEASTETRETFESTEFTETAAAATTAAAGGISTGVFGFDTADADGGLGEAEGEQTFDDWGMGSSSWGNTAKAGIKETANSLSAWGTTAKAGIKGTAESVSGWGDTARASIKGTAESVSALSTTAKASIKGTAESVSVLSTAAKASIKETAESVSGWGDTAKASIKGTAESVSALSTTSKASIKETAESVSALGAPAWGTTVKAGIKETADSASSTAKSPFSFGFGGAAGAGAGGLTNSLKNNSWGMGSLFGGGDKNEIELDPIEGLGEGANEEQLRVFEGLTDGTGEPEAPPVMVPSPPPPEAGGTASAAAPEEPPSTTEQSATDNPPTDAVAEEGEGDDGGFQAGKKTKKSKGAGGGGKKKKR